MGVSGQTPSLPPPHSLLVHGSGHKASQRGLAVLIIADKQTGLKLCAFSRVKSGVFDAFWLRHNWPFSPKWRFPQQILAPSAALRKSGLFVLEAASFCLLYDG